MTYSNSYHPPNMGNAELANQRGRERFLSSGRRAKARAAYRSPAPGRARRTRGLTRPTLPARPRNSANRARKSAAQRSAETELKLFAASLGRQPTALELSKYVSDRVAEVREEMHTGRTADRTARAGHDSYEMARKMGVLKPVARITHTPTKLTFGHVWEPDSKSRPKPARRRPRPTKPTRIASRLPASEAVAMRRKMGITDDGTKVRTGAPSGVENTPTKLILGVSQ